MKMQLVPCLCLAWTALWAALVRGGVVGQCQGGAALSGTHRVWTGDDDVTVQWRYGEDLCSTEERCVGAGAVSSNTTSTMPIQLKPVTINTHTKLKFVSAMPGVALQPWVVSLEQFLSCNSTRGAEGSRETLSIPVVDEATTNTITVDNRLLQAGNHYFIAVTDDPLFSCPFGLRLNVTVKASDCESGGGGHLCSSMGVCSSTPHMETYKCVCCEERAGRACQWWNPCYNSTVCPTSATCHPSETAEGNYTCQCPQGYTGPTCSTSLLSACSPSPCLNGGYCNTSDTAGTYSCHCVPGHTGTHCELVDNSYDPCYQEPCIHGVCMEQRPGYQCYCTPGFGGVHCELEYDECESSPCQGGGVCVDEIDAYRCECGRGYTGAHCQHKLDLCSLIDAPSTCPPHTHCRDLVDHAQCQCQPGNTEGDCELHMNECMAAPCQEHSICVDLPNGFRCFCQQGFTGALCDVSLSDAAALGGFSSGEDTSPESTIYHDQLHNVYVAAGTLAAALALAALVITTCYCRHNGTKQSLQTISQAISERSKKVTDRFPSLWRRKGSWNQNILLDKSGDNYYHGQWALGNHPSAAAIYGATARFPKKRNRKEDSELKDNCEPKII